MKAIRHQEVQIERKKFSLLAGRFHFEETEKADRKKKRCGVGKKKKKKNKTPFF